MKTIVQNKSYLHDPPVLSSKPQMHDFDDFSHLDSEEACSSGGQVATPLLIFFSLDSVPVQANPGPVFSDTPPRQAPLSSLLGARQPEGCQGQTADHLCSGSGPITQLDLV